MSSAAPLRLADGVRFRRLLDEGVMLHFEAGEILGLSDLGARVVELVRDGACEPASIAETLRAETSAHDGADVEADVRRFLDQLRELGALEADVGDTP